MNCFPVSNRDGVKKYLNKRFLTLDPGLIVVFACFTLFGCASWGRLTELIWDTGHEVEIPVRILSGQVLYRDIETYYGPLTYYLNALGIQVFGQRLEVFYVIGLVLAAIATLLVYSLTKQCTNSTWATLCTLYFLIYCAFRPGGLWNFIIPYSYGVVYATISSLIGFVALDRYGKTSNLKWLIVCAIASGLAGLSKQEYGVAALVSILVGANLYPPRNSSSILKRSALIVAIALLTTVIPLAFLAQQSSWEKLYASLLPLSKSKVLTDSGLFDVSLAKTLSEWSHTFRNFVATSSTIWVAMVLARWVARAGYLAERSSLKIAIEVASSIAFAGIGLALLHINSRPQTVLVFAVVWVAVSGTVVLAWWMNRANRVRDPISVWSVCRVSIIGILIGVGLLVLRRFSCCSITVFHPLDYMAWLLPALVIWFTLKWSHWLESQRAPLLLTLLVFSLLINARFLFYINFYGLYSVTAVLLFFILLYKLAKETNLPIARYLLIGLLIGGSANLSQLNDYRYAVESSRGVAYSQDPDLALAFSNTIKFIDSANADSVLVLPEGSTLNFLSGTSTTTRETIFIPGVLPTAEAEKDFINRIKANLPDLIVYVDVPFFWLKEGYRTYAQYNPLVHSWIEQQYRVVHSSAKLMYHGNPWTIRVYAPI